jgi:hypothetical protein
LMTCLRRIMIAAAIANVVRTSPIPQLKIKLVEVGMVRRIETYRSR